MEISEVVIGRRHREDLGDMEELKRSISEIGLLQPVVVRKGTKELVAGYRRLNALKELGVAPLIEGVHVNLIDIGSIIRGEHDENVCRKDFTISEKVAIFEAVKEEELRLGIERRILSGGTKEEPQAGPSSTGTEGAVRGARPTEASEPTSSSVEEKKKVVHGRARTTAAQAVGLHHNTLRKATEIVAAARKEPRRYTHLVREMDATGKVDPVFQKFVQERSRPATGAYDAGPTLARLQSDPMAEVPAFLSDVMTGLPVERQEELLERFSGILRTVRRSDLDDAIKRYARSRDAATLSEEDLYRAIGDVLEQADANSREWVFMEQVRGVASLIMRVAGSTGAATLLDKLEFFMIGLAGFADMACNYLQVANKEGIIKGLPPKVLEKYLAAIDAFQVLYESKLPRQVGALCRKDLDLLPGEMPHTRTARDHANAMKANEMITDVAEGDMAYYRGHIAGLIQNLREGAERLK